MKRVAMLALAVLLWIVVMPSAAAGETLAYQVIYRGVFSLGKDMPIADVRLASETSVRHGMPVQNSLVATSAAYDLVESVYPMRYRFRSWTDAESGQLIGLEAYQKTRREKHRLYLRDDSPAGVRRLDPAGEDGSRQLARLLAGDTLPVSATDPLFDRLGLLQQIRRQALSTGAEFVFPVTSGNDRMHYRVRVESATALHLDGVAVPSWKLRLDATEINGRGERVAAHRPVFVWLSRDARHLPLRIDVRHAIGLFRVQLDLPAVRGGLVTATG